MSILFRRRVRAGRGRHHADSIAEQPVLPAREGPVALHGRHANRHQPPRLQIVADFTGWGATARLCEDAAKHPVVDPQTACPARAPFDLDMTQPLFLEIPPMNSPRAFTDADVALLLADITLTGGEA